MKKLGIIIFIAALCVGLIVTTLFSFGRTSAKLFNFSIDLGGTKGSGQMASEVRDLSEFTSVDVGGVFQVEITAQRDFSVEVEADDNLLPLIKTEVVDGTLRIETTDKLKSSNPFRIRISVPDIERLDVSGAAKLNLKDLKNSRLTLDSSGASSIALTGETSQLSIDISGSTKVDAEGLSSQKASVKASGASYASVNVSDDIYADASGASTIKYAGSPANVREETSGASRVTRK